MVQQLRFGLFFFILTLFTSTSFSQEWYDLISEEHVNIETVKEKAEIYFDKTGRGKHTGYKQYRRWLDNATLNMDKNGVPYTHGHVTNELKKFNADASKRKQRRSSSDADGSWSPMGPYYAQDDVEGKRLGRLTAMAIEPVNQQLLFVGSHGGGLWRSQDAGASWTPVIDDADNMFVIAVGIDPHNTDHIVYVDDNSVIFESLDQGDTWRQILDFNRGITNVINMVTFHPTVPGVYFVATRELLRTTDGGATFTTVLDEDNRDIFFKPGDPTTVYSVGQDFWKSTDSGETWKKITNGIDISARMRMTVTQADPNRVYILQKDPDTGQFGRIYKSTDSGTSFEVMADKDKGAPLSYLGNQGWRCLSIMCSDTDPDKLHMGGINHFRSDDAGATLYLAPNSSGTAGVAHIHADILIMTSVNGTLYAATDGGIFRSTDAGATYTALTGGLSTATGGLTITQFYRMASTSPYPGTGVNSDPDMIMGGAQDNGTQIGKGADHDWEQWLGSDGMECLIDYNDDNNLYGSKQYGTLMYSKDRGASFRVLNTPEGDDRGAWTTPFTMDPVSSTTLYVGFEDLHMSTNSGDSWEKMTSGQTNGSYIDQIAVALTDNNYMYFAQGSRLWVSTNAQSSTRTWRRVSQIGSSVNDITIDHNDHLHALVATSGSTIYETKDGGESWTNISGNLPDISVKSVLMDNSPENTIYAGTFRGVYYKNDNMTEWESFGKGLPKVDVRELEINYQAKKLRVATYGRGIWEIPIFGTNTSISPKVIAETNQKCLGESIQLSIEENLAWEAPISYQWFRNEVLISGATKASYNALENGSYTVEVTANEASGTSSGTSLSFLETPLTPSVTDEKICGPGNVTFTATGSENGVLKWYSDKEGTNELAEGSIFSIDVTETSSFYVKETSSASVTKVGMEDKEGVDGRYHEGGPYLIMDVENAFTLKSVKVYAEEAGDRTFEVRDANEVLIVSKTMYVKAGESRVALDLAIPVGNDLMIGIEEDGLKLYRSKGDIGYPLISEDIVTIKSSTIGLDYYYFLYDWEIQTGSKALCSSLSSPVTVVLDDCVGLSTYDNEHLTLFPNPTPGLIHLELPENFELKTIEVTDIQGNSLLTHHKYVEQIDLQDFKAGAYLVKVTGERGIKVFKVDFNR